MALAGKEYQRNQKICLPAKGPLRPLTVRVVRCRVCTVRSCNYEKALKIAKGPRGQLNADMHRLPQ
jgi:hypothetical protein